MGQRFWDGNDSIKFSNVIDYYEFVLEGNEDFEWVKNLDNLSETELRWFEDFFRSKNEVTIADWLKYRIDSGAIVEIEL